MDNETSKKLDRRYSSNTIVDMASRFWLAVLLVVVGLGCTKRGNTCESDQDCTDPAYPFCDVNGEYAESGNRENTCSIVPQDCPIERCGCVPGVATCADDHLTTCNADGRSATTVSCALGCAASEPRCATFDPSNGLSAALAQAAAEGDVVVPDMSTVDTTTGAIRTSLDAPVEIKSILLTQGGATIRVFLARSFKAGGLVVSGSYAAAFVVSGSITLTGLVDASANGATSGPGGVEAAACCGAITQAASSGATPGGGGGGNGTTGATGGGYAMPGKAGGEALTDLRLAGGCRGGEYRDVNGLFANAGGAGGGALQFVSLESVTITGMIHVGGGGGQSFAGGGSGGTVIIEAPAVTIDGVSAGIAANGGAGGACDNLGNDATPDGNQALGPGAPNCKACGGAGGTGQAMANPGCVLSSSLFASATFGGGGGALGRLAIATRDGEVEVIGNPLLSAVVTKSTLVPK